MALTSKRSPSETSIRTSRGVRSIKVRHPQAAVIGLEAEFSVFVNDEKCLPEKIFGTPKNLVRGGTIPRAGRSVHLPSGGALYFDTGVVEVATPIIELEAGCCVRGVRSLWEQIEFVRKEIDAWEEAHQCRVRLEGFSTHYNISIPAPRHGDLWNLARVLTYLLHPPVMLLAANRRSSGVGVRPRGNRLEVTVDFTPDPALMMATTTFIVAAILEVLAWPEVSLDELKRRGIPIITGFAPMKHTSRKGFLARFDCFPKNPFAADPNAAEWKLTDGRTLSLREMALEIARPFRRSMQAMGDRTVTRHILAVLTGRARSLLDFEDRPRKYEDAGRSIDWNRRKMRDFPRSRYERVIQRVITHRPIQVGASLYQPERMHGWYEVVFRNTRTGNRRVFNLDELVKHCAA
jgi:hypothetical protein